MLRDYFNATSLFEFLLLIPQNAPWHQRLFIWMIRILTISLLLRTYIVPWALARISNHIRIRSISLRSLRGLYVKTGSRTWRVDRIAYKWSYTEGMSRFGITVRGLSLEIGGGSAQPALPRARRHKRGITLADFAPSPMARRIWAIVHRTYALGEPFVRPALGTLVATCLRQMIRWLPQIAQRLTFDLTSAVVTFKDLPGTQIGAESVHVQFNLAFSHLDNAVEYAEPTIRRRPSRLYNWKNSFTESLRRSWDRAWGRAEGTVSLSLEIANVAGHSVLSAVGGQSRRFIAFPGLINVQSSLRFSPKKGTLDPLSLRSSLDVGECYVAVDVIRSLLDMYKANRPSYVPPQDPESDPMSPLSDGPEFSDTLSPSSASFFAPPTPSSPFLEAISASMRSRLAPKRSVLKLSKPQAKAMLSLLQSFTVHITTIRLVSQPAGDVGASDRIYEGLVQDITLELKLSEPSLALHRRWLGGTSDSLQSDSYIAEVSMSKITFDRYVNGNNLRILTLGRLSVAALAYQWPTPWLTTSQFLCGDPNAPIIALQLEATSLRLTEHIEFLNELLVLKSPSLPRSPIEPPNPKMQLPRIAIEAKCGFITASIICGVSRHQGSPRAIELRSNSFEASLSSEFSHTPVFASSSSKGSQLLPLFLPVQMKIDFSAVLAPTLVRIRIIDPTQSTPPADGVGTSESAFLDDPAVLSLEALEFSGQARLQGDLNDTSKNLSTMDLESTLLDIHGFTDTISVELWHPAVLAVAHELSGLLGARQSLPPVTTRLPAPASLLDRLPIGVSATVACSRFVVFVTSPELNRKDDLDLSRGCAFRGGLRLQYCFLRAANVVYFKDILKSSQTRHKLYLPEEHIREALATARTASMTGVNAAFFKVLVTNLVLRTAVASPFSPDDPFIIERDNPDLAGCEFLRVKRIVGETKVTGKRHSTHYSSNDFCDVAITIPHAQGDFQMSNVYAILLASRTLRGLLPHGSPRSRTTSSSALSLKISCEVKYLHCVWKLPKQTVVTRLESLKAHSSQGGPAAVRFTRFRAYVQRPGSHSSRPPPGEDQKWIELGCFQGWEVSLPQPAAKPVRILVSGDSARLRIPHGYILADLILDISVVVKAARHLVKVLPTGRFSSIPKPEAEGPKSVPHISMRVRCICVEAADDPFESKLAVIYRAGYEASRFREQREKAFDLKVAAILGVGHAEPLSAGNIGLGDDYRFSTEHSVSIEEARQRLDQLHAFDWKFRQRGVKETQARTEEAILQELTGQFTEGVRPIPNVITPEPVSLEPPLVRLMLNDVTLTISPPSFPAEALSDFMYQVGSGLPKDTQFYLLVPLHFAVNTSALRVSLRDYPVPLLNISRLASESADAVTFQTDLVIAEEVGSDLSVEWIECPIIPRDYGIAGAAPLSVSVPKTIMPVKTYAKPTLQVTTRNVTTVSWGVSYMPVLQDLTRIVDTLTTPPRDASPGVGFWDKLRLVMHWKLNASFRGDVHVHLKGSRDPYEISGDGAGFVLACHGSPKVLVGFQNKNDELIQIISDSLTGAIPSQESLRSLASMSPPADTANLTNFRKVCAKLSSGVRLGIRFLMERSCGPECLVCSGTAFHRRCRIFTFRPHYEIKLEKKTVNPNSKDPDDSFNGFRSDFIHMSLSLAASTSASNSLPLRHLIPNSFHLTPKVFAHFWSWLALFDSTLSLPVRQGKLYPRRLVSPKFGKQLATLKYRISVPQLFVFHAYVDDSRETWADGVTPFIGIKAMIDDVQIDMHQRDQETIVPGRGLNEAKLTRHKALYAAEVVLKGLDLRAVLATFVEPLKQAVPVTCPPERSNYRTRNKLPIVDSSSPWIDRDDFTETDWKSTAHPEVTILPIMSCPRFNYCKRNPSSQENHVGQSKFGSEASHICMLGKESPSTQIQTELATERIAELKQHVTPIDPNNEMSHEPPSMDRSHTEKMITLLEEYVCHLQDASPAPEDERYFFPSEHTISDEWTTFNNVYQIHCPKIFMNSAIRDVMIQYYNCSRQRRGFEYHIATRAVRFILDQAAAASAISQKDVTKIRTAFHAGQAAASALRKILTNDNGKSSIEVSDLPTHMDVVDPLNGWSDAVSLNKSHFCLLLKPQIILRSEKAESICILAAVQAKLQSFNIMDKSNADDPISGKVMVRSYGSLTGLQAFSPVDVSQYRDGGVPLEVLVDFRCESDVFDRLVPQTDATFRYDKFNRLRLRNKVTSVPRVDSKGSMKVAESHLQNQTDLIQINIPRFTVTASEQHFQTIADIMTNVILFSDVAHKTRLDKLETLLFTYDFTDLVSAANVVSDVQSRLRTAVEIERLALARTDGQETENIELFKLKSHICLLAEELTFLFDAIKMAQDRMEDSSDQKSALLLHASSSDISWRMLDEYKGLLAKLAVRNINFYWLSRRDSSTVNNLAVGDLQAFDGSRNAMWTEVLCKYDEPPNHPLLKKGLFLLAHWIVLAPVGGITIYEEFQLNFHPLRLQIDADLGRRMMEYLWPARRNRSKESTTSPASEENGDVEVTAQTSLDSPGAVQNGSFFLESSTRTLKPPPLLRRLGPSRSFTDLRSTGSSSLAVPRLQRRGSSEALHSRSIVHDSRPTNPRPGRRLTFGDAAEMKSRSSQKSFVLVQIASLHILLSVKKDDSFECRDARIRTRDLEYRNQTWSFEELVNQFIPSDMSWKGWLKMAFHQPLLPVFPVARELLSKTKWITPPKSNHDDMHRPLSRSRKASLTPAEQRAQMQISRTPSPHRRWRRTSIRRPDTPSNSTSNSSPLVEEPDSMAAEVSLAQPKPHKGRVLGLFHRGQSRSRKSVDLSPANSRTTTPAPTDSDQIASNVSRDGSSSHRRSSSTNV